jgi:hypothetical protein
MIVVLACSPDRAGDVADSAMPSQPVERADPAASLDREFQRARSALNEEAEALGKLDRASPGYTSRYEAWLRDAAAAESLRIRRDSLRRASPPPPSA